jgi:ribosomal protein S20
MLAINQAAFQARTYVQNASTAVQNNDMQGALMDLDLATKSIDNILSNLTSTTAASGANQTSTTGGATASR